MAAWDDSEAGRAGADKAGIPLVDLFREDWSRFAALVLAPGVPLTHPEPHWTVQKAEAAGVEVIGDIELFCRERASLCPEAPFIAITGTNGKSTTTALIAHILTQAGRDVQLGGNIGRAVLTLDPLTLDRVYVVECSSFQIDLAPTIRPSVGVLLNVTPDHLDRHGTIGELRRREGTPHRRRRQSHGRHRRRLDQGHCGEIPLGRQGDPHRLHTRYGRYRLLGFDCLFSRASRSQIWPASHHCAAVTTARMPARLMARSVLPACGTTRSCRTC